MWLGMGEEPTWQVLAGAGGILVTMVVESGRGATRRDPLYLKKLGLAVCESRIPRLAGRADGPFSGPCCVMQPSELDHMGITCYATLKIAWLLRYLPLNVSK